jgi:hypothetical protein
MHAQRRRSTPRGWVCSCPCVPRNKSAVCGQRAAIARARTCWSHPSRLMTRNAHSMTCIEAMLCKICQAGAGGVQSTAGEGEAQAEKAPAVHLPVALTASPPVAVTLTVGPLPQPSQKVARGPPSRLALPLA